MSVKIVADRFILGPETPRKGGMATVYKARDHLQDGDYVALKLFDIPGIEIRREDLQRERDALQALQHENIVVLHAAGFDEKRGQQYVALQWIDEHLGQYIERRTQEAAPDESNPGAGWDSFLSWSSSRCLRASRSRILAGFSIVTSSRKTSL